MNKNHSLNFALDLAMRVIYRNSQVPLGVFIFLLLSILLSCSVALTLALGSGYGGNPDTYGMLATFLSALHDGQYHPSRYTGYPAAELIVGFVAWLGGSALANASSFIMFFMSSLLFPYCFIARPSALQRFLFAALTLSSPVLLFDSIVAIDYPYALFFWVAGTACLNCFSNASWAIIPLALSVGCRPNFLVFAIISVLLVGHCSGAGGVFWGKVKSRIPVLLAVLFASSLFYLPVWISDSFGFAWVSAALPDAQGKIGMIIRFIYKIPLAFGFVQFAIICAYAFFSFPPGFRLSARSPFYHRLNEMLREGLFPLLLIVIANLIIFWQIPTNFYYLQPLLFVVYFCLSCSSAKKALLICLVIISLNHLNWLVRPQLLSLSHRSDIASCSSVVANGGRLGIWLDHGRLAEYDSSMRKSNCYVKSPVLYGDYDYAPLLLSGRPLRFIK